MYIPLIHSLIGLQAASHAAATVSAPVAENKLLAMNGELAFAMQYRHSKKVLHDVVAVRNSPIHGKGLYAKAGIVSHNSFLTMCTTDADQEGANHY